LCTFHGREVDLANPGICALGTFFNIFLQLLSIQYRSNYLFIFQQTLQLGLLLYANKSGWKSGQNRFTTANTKPDQLPCFTSAAPDSLVAGVERSISAMRPS